MTSTAAAQSRPAARVDSDSDVKALCSRLRAIKSIPDDRFEKTGDPIYDGLFKAGEKAVPCLIEKILDTRPTSEEQVVCLFPHLRVGDAAVFMLMAIVDEPWKPSEMFPPKYAKMFETQGMFAYFAYVEHLQNRKKIQDWWRKWAEQHKTNLRSSNTE